MSLIFLIAARFSLIKFMLLHNWNAHEHGSLYFDGKCVMAQSTPTVWLNLPTQWWGCTHPNLDAIQPWWGISQTIYQPKHIHDWPTIGPDSTIIYKYRWPSSINQAITGLLFIGMPLWVWECNSHQKLACYSLLIEIQLIQYSHCVPFFFRQRKTEINWCQSYQRKLSLLCLLWTCFNSCSKVLPMVTAQQCFWKLTSGDLSHTGPIICASMPLHLNMPNECCVAGDTLRRGQKRIEKTNCTAWCPTEFWINKNHPKHYSAAGL